MVLYLKALLGFGGFLGTGGLSLFGAYELTKKTVSDGLKGVGFIEEESLDESIWTKLKEKINSKIKTDSKLLSSLKEKTSSTFSEFNEICKQEKEKIYWTLFSEDVNLLEDFKNFCTIKFGEIFENANKFSTSENIDADDFGKLEQKLNDLKSHSEEQKGILPKNLKDLKERISKDNYTVTNKDKKELAKWCIESYDFYFSKKSDNEWKHSETYCKK